MAYCLGQNETLLINKVIEKQIIPRKFTPNEVCNLVEVVLDEKASALSGQVIYVGGI